MLDMGIRILTAMHGTHRTRNEQESGVRDDGRAFDHETHLLGTMFVLRLALGPKLLTGLRGAHCRLSRRKPSHSPRAPSTPRKCGKLAHARCCEDSQCSSSWPSLRAQMAATLIRLHLKAAVSMKTAPFGIASSGGFRLSLPHLTRG